ncbi:3-oxoacyl-ACP synthase [Flavobacterium macacae]|uniref:3-oxoacyl-ACP synthase n=1 Tax=Flavobacterium macacae TaxID=2488993 RepID=A0A3P3WHD9_9FLAO|nr:3-oxoacyl-ACP synthase [Flavobacterium macacae]RRJ94008.1 3-oxoacyl-ACP synthase [Flavobacterium macacae]
MEKKTYINSYCKIEKNAIWLNGEKIFESKEIAFPEFAKEAYKNFDISYPKFFKMDSLSKITFLASEIILKETINPEMENDIALLFANRSSSLDTDVKYQKSISDKNEYFPSPAVFVYTLANICMGEISIKNQLKSENCFFIFDAFNWDFMANYSKILIETEKAEKVLCAWTELYQEDYEVFMYLVSAEGTLENTKENLENLYKK